ncbi:hypothetical protein LINPERPRIM_LOCUS27726 [Linum perenne]
MPQLRLAPPAVYHERIPKSPQQLLTGGTKLENQSRKLKDIKVKGTSLRFPLKTSIFGETFSRMLYITDIVPGAMLALQ